MAEFKDTLQLATEVKAKQGVHELEVSFGGELDLHKHFDNCPKNPGHVDFIPVNKFSRSDLPEAYQASSVYSRIRCLANLTVKISVTYVSPHRPPGFELSDLAGQNILSVGSGYFSHVIEDKRKNRFSCPIKNCSKSVEPHDVFGYFSIFTAAHVVFDDIEAENTCVEFFYDDPKDKSRVKKAEGVKVVTKSVEGDFTELLCVSHDESLSDDIGFIQQGCSCSKRKQLLLEIVSADISDEKFIHLSGTVSCDLSLAMYNLLKNMAAHYFNYARWHDNFEYLIDYFNRELKEISQVVCALESFVEHTFGSFEWRPEIRVMGNSQGQAKLLKGIIVLNKFKSLSDYLHSKLHERIRFPDLKTFYVDEILSLRVQNDVKRLAKISLQNLSSRIFFPNGDVTMFLEGSDFENNPTGALCPEDEDKSLVVTISHPHGQSKQITIGDLISCDTASGFYSHIYSCSTCNGSSGAPVWIMPSKNETSLKEVYGILHKGHHGNKVNEGNAWTIYPTCYVHRNPELINTKFRCLLEKLEKIQSLTIRSTF